MKMNDLSVKHLISINDLETNLSDIESYLKRYHNWRLKLIKSKTLYDFSDVDIPK